MTHAHTQPPYAPINLAVVTPGPTLTVYTNGVETARILLAPDAALHLAGQLIAGVQVRADKDAAHMARHVVTL